MHNYEMLQAMVNQFTHNDTADNLHNQLQNNALYQYAINNQPD